mmetsp:Transcript_5962/g.8917  ORF Transcript_5962/g.8917 Transcript_5962/m.8917 type:complete len:718 (+) Transcript_5962:275-2428(+)
MDYKGQGIGQDQRGGQIYSGSMAAFDCEKDAITGKNEKFETIAFSFLKRSFSGSDAAAALTVSYVRKESLRIGQTVRITALSKAKSFNGALGVICGPQNSRKRYPVMIWETRRVLGLQDHNLICILGGGEEMRTQVIIIGAGAAGLSAAKMLQDRKISSVVLEGRPRIGGRTFTYTLPERKKFGVKEELVDMGASYIHRCDSENGIYKLALEQKPSAAIGAGNRWADTECARWFDERTGREMSVYQNSRIHLLHWKMSVMMTRIAKKLGEEKAKNVDLLTVFDQAKKKILKLMKDKLDPIEERMLETIKTRMWGYISRPEDTAAELVRHQLQEDVDLDPNVATRSHSQRYSFGLSARIAQTCNPKVSPINAADGSGDRLLAKGYGPFLVKYLSKGVRCITNKSVSKISISSTRSANPSKRRRAITVRCRDGTTYTSEYVICTVPIGVLQSTHPDSKIDFEPPLPKEKVRAIKTLGSGYHAKIILRFKPNEVFWPTDCPQLVPLDQRFHILNLHAYGKKGVLCAHVWPPFADGFDKMNDKQVVEELLKTLKGMFWREGSNWKSKGGLNFAHLDTGNTCTDFSPTAMLTEELSRLGVDLGTTGGPPRKEKKSTEKERGPIKMMSSKFPKPIDSIVARWDSDPFSLGSYSYLKLGAGWGDIAQLSRAYPMRDPRIFFGGEATSLEAIQCVLGAYNSGIRTAKEVLAAMVNRRRRGATGAR